MFWLVILTVKWAYAGTVLIQGAQSPTLDYLAVLKAHADYTTPSQEYLSSHPSLAQREQLLNFLSEAQKAFLLKSNPEAQAKFTELLTLLRSDDWDKSDREIFLQAYLRLAQMEPDAGLRDRWLGESLLLGDAALDSSLYPPPLLSRRREMAKNLPTKNVARYFHAAGWSHVLVNGQHCQKLNCGQWPLYPGHVRITVLSDQWLPQSMIVDLAELERFHPPVKAWAEGRCGEPRLSSAAEKFHNKKIFWSLDCEKPEPPIALNFQPVVPGPLPPPASLPTFPPVAPKPEPFYYSKWFWAGVGIVAAVLAVSASQKKETKEPSTTYGY